MRLSAPRGIQAEVLLSLALVMVTATALLTAFFFKTHVAQLDRLQAHLGRALAAEARAPTFAVEALSPTAVWWVVRDAGVARARTRQAPAIDPVSLALAEEARATGEPLLRAGAPWEPLRFAVLTKGSGEVAVARLPAAVSRSSVALLVLADAVVFGIFGATLLRRRVVGPLQRLAAASRTLAEGELGTRVPVEGSGEAAELAWAFNEMGEALEVRTGALEKAVAELRDTNAHLRRARDGLDRAERLAAVGHLAAGVAHEVGNPMGALLAFLDLAGRDEGIGKTGREHLKRAAGEGERVRKILRQLLDFSRPPRASFEVLDLGALARESSELVRAQRRYSRIEFEIDEAESLPRALGDSSMVGQIVLNLLINAADAVCDLPEARVRIRLRAAPLRVREREREKGTGGLEEAAADKKVGGVGERRSLDGVECAIEDNGPGVSEEDGERIFDPFFTTKPPGEGTGLGLANAQRLAEEQGGVLEHEASAELAGACFRLRLPMDPDGGDPSVA